MRVLALPSALPAGAIIVTMTLVRGGWVVLVSSFLTAHWMAGQNADTVRAVGKLELHRVIERQLGPGQTDEYRIGVAGGQFVRLVARQMGVDVIVTVLDPRGKTVLEADRLNGVFGPEAASWVADISGQYLVRISSSSPTAGRYDMELVEQREPTAADRSRIEAERAGWQAERERKVGSRSARLRSIELYEVAGSIWRALKDVYEGALSLSTIASIYSDLGQKQKALDYFGQALPLFRASGDRPGEAQTLSNIGAMSDALGDQRKALDYFGRALPLFRAAGDRPGEAMTLSNIGAMHDALGDKQEALDYYGQALPIRRAVGDRSGEAGTLNNIGIVYAELGEMQKALDYYGQALPIRRAAGDRPGEAGTLNNIGAVYDSLGEKQKALDYYGRALPIRRASATAPAKPGL